MDPADELKRIKDDILNTVHGIEFLTARRNECFQMQGRYDGAMSEECKQMFRDEFQLIDALLREFSAATEPGEE